RPGLPSRLDEILAGPLSRKPIDRPSRPAQVLRSLIELSYESSIMATALDVAEAVAAVLPAKRISGTGQQLDDVIRKQLGAAQDKSVARRTAVTDGKPPSTETVERDADGKTSTGLFRKVGKDGISRLEEVDPTAVAAPRAKRATGQVDSIKEAPKSPDSAMHELLDAKVDPDRRTEVGGPPAATAPVPKAEGAKDISITQTETPAPSRRGLAFLIIAVVLGGGGFAVWKLTKKTQAPVVIAHADAAVEEQLGYFVIDPEPEGASGSLTDENGDVHRFGPTSHDPKKQVRMRVTAKTKFKIHIELSGYNPYDTESTVLPNETVRIGQKLDKATAILHVETTPAGAQVALDGKLLGETPLTRDGLDATSGELTITHAGYEPQRLKITLELGKTVDVKRDLKELAKMGTVMIELTGSANHAEALYKGKSLGQTRTLAGVQALRLPIGKQQITLVHPTTKKTKVISIEVTDQPQTIKASFD
ncbi:MAG TPA: PEGA domain-containing protein, partial [Kofleriaceae bacterium]|nr:PEGA domain-containing protein [Kofleriaceae bacterium]